MYSDERFARRMELHGVITKAKEELKSFEPSKHYLVELEEMLDEMEADGDLESKIDRLGELVARSLNLLMDKGEGEVVIKAQSQIELHTNEGHLTFDPDNDDWYFTGSA